ncbi:NADPH-dependent F420 reductase [Nocardia sp. NPDC003693]
MRIGVIGSGAVGSAVGRLLGGAGHDVLFAGRDPERAADAALGAGGRAGSVTDAIDHGRVIVLAVPFDRVADVALAHGLDLTGKIVIDPTNPMIFTLTDIVPIELPAGLTGSQLQQQRLPGARIVKAFNHFLAGDLLRLGRQGQAGLADPVAMFFAGDDELAKDVVTELIRDAGFTPIDIGGLAESHLLEYTAPGFLGADPLTPAEAFTRLERAERAR